MRTLGVEEEILVVDDKTGNPLPLGGQIVDLHEFHDFGRQFTFTTQIQREQVELVTPICGSLEMLELCLRNGRSHADSPLRGDRRTVSVLPHSNNSSVAITSMSPSHLTKRESECSTVSRSGCQFFSHWTDPDQETTIAQPVVQVESELEEPWFA